MRAVVASVVVATLVVIGLIARDVDLSPTPELRNDLAFRSRRTDAPLTYRHDDPAPWVAHLPAAVFVHRSLRDGELPLWDPHPGGGVSPVRRFQHAVFHPLRLLSVVVPERQAQSFTLVFALAFAFAGAFLVARKLGASLGASAIAAVTFAFSSHMLTSLQAEFPLVVAHLPWLVLAFARLVDSAALEPRALALAAIVVALLVLAGHPGVEVATLVTALVVVAARSPSLKLWRTIPAGALGVSLSAIAWAPFLVELRDAWTYKYESGFGALYAPIRWHLWPSIVADVVLFEEPSTSGDYVDAYAWLGPLVALLAIGGCIVAARERAERWRVVVFVVAFLFCLPGPWMAWARHVPGLWTIKPWYLYGALPFACSLCAALAWDALQRRVPLVAKLAPLVAFVIATTTMARDALWVVPHGGAYPPASAVVDVVRTSSSPVRITAPPGAALLPDSSAITEVDDIRTHGATLSRRWVKWFELVDADVQKRTFPSTRATPFVDAPLMRSFAIDFALEPLLSGPDEWRVDPNAAPTSWEDASLAPSPRLQPRSDLDLVLDDGFVRLWHIPKARARVDGARDPIVVANEADAIEALRHVDVDAHDVVEGPVGPVAHDPGAIAATSFARPTNASLVVDVDAKEDALVVVEELYEEGWTATVDGAPAEIHAVNLIARGVRVPAGHHVVRMRYMPPGLVAGACLSTAGVVVIALMFRRRRLR